MNAKKIDLVRQLLAKAESTTPEEAEALTAAAEKLMLRLGIDDAMLAASGKQDDSPVVTKTLWFTGPYRDGMYHAMYYVLGSLQTCSAIHVRSGRRDGLRIYGRESQVDRAILLLSSLEIQAMVAMRDWWKTNRDLYSRSGFSESQKKRSRRQFILSFGHGAALRIESERTVIETEVTGSALVLLDQVAQAKLAIADDYPDLPQGRPLKGGADHAARAGRTAGERANVGTTQVGNRKRISS